MTITIVGVGAAVSAVNAPVTPAFHASTLPGDLVLILASIRNSGAGTVDQPAGWGIVPAGNMAILAHVIQPGDVAPTVTFSGGVANADTMAQALTVRGTVGVLLNFVAALNASAQNIAYPAAGVPEDGCLVILAGWKQDDCVSVTTPAGFTGIGTTIVAAGDDATQTWHFQIQTTKTTIGASSIVVSGGVAAISRAMVLVFSPVQITAVEQSSDYPPRVLVSVTGLTIGDAVQVSRIVGGVRTPLRGGSSAAVTDPAFLVFDSELPFGVPVSYVVNVAGFEYFTQAAVHALPGGKVALSDAISGAAAEVVILAWPEKAYEREATTFKVAGRNIVVSGELAQFESSADLYVEATSSVDNLLALVKVATSGVVQVRQPGGYDGVDCYVAVTGMSVKRFSQDGSDDRRVVTLQLVETDGWPAALAASGVTYADLETEYAGLTYANLAADFPTYLALAQAEF